MNKTTTIILVFLCILHINCTAQKSNFSTLIVQKAAAIEQKVITWRQDLHKNPELGNREYRTAEIIAKHLQSLGIDVQSKVAVTGVVGVLKGGKPGPVIALRADMDALPIEEVNNLPFASKVKTIYNGKETNVMHACGHDAHVAILMGVAEILAGMKSELRGTVKFIFQPAEEGAPDGEKAGASLMVNEGVLENPKVDVIFGLHMDAQLERNRLSYCPGPTFAGVSDFKITVKGKPSHGSQPWLAIDPIFVAAQIITSLQQIVSRNVKLTENAAVITVGVINGGVRSNVIPSHVEMRGDIRSLSAEDEAFIYGRLRQVVENTAEAAGAVAILELPLSDKYPVTFNNIELTEAMLPSLQKSAGSDKVDLVKAVTGAEDFSFFAQKVPGLYFRLGGLPHGKDINTSAPHHTPEFIIDDQSFKTGVVALCNLVFDYPYALKKK